MSIFCSIVGRYCFHSFPSYIVTNGTKRKATVFKKHLSKCLPIPYENPAKSFLFVNLFDWKLCITVFVSMNCAQWQLENSQYLSVTGVPSCCKSFFIALTLLKKIHSSMLCWGSLSLKLYFPLMLWLVLIIGITFIEYRGVELGVTHSFQNFRWSSWTCCES